ncbi:MAG: NUDIX hydrolase [Desulfobacteraceae bacterium]|nr:NUDIX hydrolase [Desulfobacteraceae bacterium]
MEQKKFCHFCGNSLTRKHTEGRQRPYCNHCSRPIYENPVPATCLVVVNPSNEILLVKRSVEPQKGQWCLPGGFMELGESPSHGALRELKEETGLTGQIKSLLGVSSSASMQYHSILMIGYLITSFKGRPEAGDDADAIGWFAFDRLPPVAFSSHQDFIYGHFGQ